MDLCEAGGSEEEEARQEEACWEAERPFWWSLGAGWPGTSGCGCGNWVMDGSFSLGERDSLNTLGFLVLFVRYDKMGEDPETLHAIENRIKKK